MSCKTTAKAVGLAKANVVGSVVGMGAWNGWYHCTGSTYGCWLRGDARGWRSRKHREHVDGDYKKPPAPGRYTTLEQNSQSSIKRQRVILTPAQRAFLCGKMATALVELQVDLIAMCVSAKHWHALARFRVKGKHRFGEPRDARTLIGKAKGKSARALSKAQLIPPGGVWAKRCRTKPIADRAHQLRTARYIPEHAKKGAAVWFLGALQAKPTASAVVNLP